MARSLLVATLFLSCLAVPAFAAPCTLSTPDNWTGTVSNDWSTGGNWDGTVPGGTTNACITSATNNPVTLSSAGSVASLQLGAANSLNINGTLSIGGSSLINDGAIALNSALELTGNLTLSGAGTFTMTGVPSPTSGGQIGTNGSGWTLANQSTIQGSGLIGSNSITFSNLNLNNSGTINANSTANALVIGGSGSAFTNSGTFEATGGGTLGLSTPGPINNSGGLILSDGAGSTVNVSATIAGGTLTTSNGGVMQTTSGGAKLDASTQGVITISDGSTYTATAGTTSIIGQLNLGTVTGGTLTLGGALELTGNTTLSGPGGVVNISGTASNQTGGQIGTNGGGWVLTNNVTLQGSGTIGSNSITFQNLSLANNGTIDANTSGAVLAITGNGSAITNTGLLEATSGGILTLTPTAVITNSSANISAIGAGSTVNIGATIVGGTLTTSGGGIMQTMAGGAKLDASGQAITVADGSTYTSTAGTTSIIGQLNLGTVTGSTLALGGALELTGNTTISGPGVVNISGVASSQTGGQIGTNGGGWVLTNNSTIQGSGTIGSNSITFQNLSLTNNGTINANTSGAVLAITGNGGAITNASLLEATSGGILTLTPTAAIDNSTGNISAIGAGSTVNIGATIMGGTLNTSGGGIMQTLAGGAKLDAASHGAIMLSDGSTYTSAAGTTAIIGQLNLGTVTGSTLALGGQFQLVGNTTFSGPGVVTMTGDPSVPTGGQIGTNGGGWTLSNLSTIQGSGLIGSNAGVLFQNLSLANSGTINANTGGATLAIAGNGGSIVNTGLLEATSGGSLNLATSSPIQNGGGNITASGIGSTVNVSNTSIQGGMLNTSGGGMMQTVGNSLLDGSSVNGAVTISDGTTYTSGAAATTRVIGTLNLGTATGGTLALAGQMQLVGNTTLSGPGSLTMSGASIGTNGGGWVLTNQSTISGTGLMGSNVGILFSNGSVDNQGSIIANGGLLTVAETSGITNTGTLQANIGSSLTVTSPLSTSTFSGATLHTGTYNAFTGGTIQLNSLGTTGGEIHSNNGTILLDGVNSNIVDANGLDALSALSDNSGRFTIRNGRDFTSLSPFSNEGILEIGTGSTFFTGSGPATSYSQTAGTTTVDGVLDPLNIDVFSGLLDGIGSIDGALTVDLGGIVTPGDAGSTGTLTDNGDVTLNGTLNIGIAGLSNNDFLDVTGQANLGGTLELVALDGFTLAGGDTFFLLEDGTRNGTFTTVDTAGLNLGAGLTAELLYDQGANDNEVELVINGATAATPEPGTWFMLALGLGALVLLRRKAVRA